MVLTYCRGGKSNKEEFYGRGEEGTDGNKNDRKAENNAVNAKHSRGKEECITFEPKIFSGQTDRIERKGVNMGWKCMG